VQSTLSANRLSINASGYFKIWVYSLLPGIINNETGNYAATYVVVVAENLVEEQRWQWFSGW